MDYRIRRSALELESTGYVEIVPGRYTGTHWTEGSLFIWEDAFGMAEGIIVRHFPEYDHLDMNDIPKAVGVKVIAEWRQIASRLQGMTPAQAHEALNLQASFGERLDAELETHCKDIAVMLTSLAVYCDAFYQQEEWVCILGV